MEVFQELHSQLRQRPINNFGLSIDYSLIFANGNSSDPNETANRALGGQDPRPRDIPFNWDQRHTLNLTAIYQVPNDFSISTIVRYASGQPYTPELGVGFHNRTGTKFRQETQLCNCRFTCRKIF